MSAFLIGTLIVALIAMLSIGWNLCVDLFFRFLYFIGSWLLKLIDFVQSLFRRLCGMGDTVADPNELLSMEDDPLWNLVNSEEVRTAFLSVLLLSIVLVFIFAMIQIIRLEYTTEGSKNAKGPIIKSALKSIFFFAFIPVVSLIGIGVCNVVINIVDVTTNKNKETTSVAGAIFHLATDNEANPYISLDKNGEEGAIDWSYNLDSWWSILLDRIPIIGSFIGSGAFDGEYNEETGIKGEPADAKGANSTAGMRKVFIYDGKICGPSILGVENYISDADSLASTFKKISSEAVKVSTQPTHSGEQFERKAVELNKDDILNYTNSEAVYYFYNVQRIDYVVLFLGGWFALKALITAAFGVAMRIYKVLILFIISPYPVSLSVLDGGSALNKWKGSFLRELFSAYGVVVGLNLFLILFGLINESTIFNFFSGNPLSTLFNGLTKLIMLLVGCLMIGDIVGIISDFIGGGNAMKEGKGMQDQVTKMAAKAGTAAIGGLTLAAAGATAIGGLAQMGASTVRAKMGHKTTRLDKMAMKQEKNAVENIDEQITSINDNTNLTAEQKENKIKKLEKKKSKHLQNIKDIEGRAEERQRRDEERIATGNRSFLRGKALVSNAFMGTKAFQYVNKSAYNMLTSKGVAELDKSISGMSDEHASTMGAAKEADKRKPERQSVHRGTGAIRDFGRKITGVVHITENSAATRTEIETARKEREAVEAIDVKVLQVESVDFGEANLAIENNNSSEALQADIAKNLDAYMKKADMFAPTKDAAKEEKEAYKLIAQSSKVSGPEKDKLLKDASDAMKRAKTKGGDATVLFHEKALEQIKAAMRAGTTTPRNAPAQFGKDSDQAANLNHIIQNSLSAAIAKIQNSQSDAKTANSLQELIRSLIDEVKKR